jgi:glutamine synthetase
MLQDGKNLLEGWEAGQGGLAEHFLSGILAHLPALLPFTVPTPLSYERMKPGALHLCSPPRACCPLQGFCALTTMAAST